MFSTLQTCGHCLHPAHLGMVFVSERYWEKRRSPHSRGGLELRVLGDEDDIDAYGVATCPLCGGPNLALFRTKRRTIDSIREVIKESGAIFGGESVISVTAVYPTPPAIEMHAAWPADAAKLVHDAGTMHRQKLSPSIVIATLRSALEIAVGQLGATGANLKMRINDLHRRGVITQPLQDWAHALRLEGNEAVHETVGTAEQAAELLGFCRMFLDMTFTLPHTIEQRRIDTPH